MGKKKSSSERRILLLVVHALLLSESSWNVASEDIENNKLSSHTNTHTQYSDPFLINSIFAKKRKRKRITSHNIRVD